MDGFDEDNEKIEEHEYLLPHFKRGATRLTNLRYAIGSIFIVILLILPFLSYYYGFQNGQARYPRLPTDGVTSDAVQYQLQLLDDEFDVELDGNARFKGPPRPELDAAWESLITAMHIRVPHDRAVEANFTSLELGDGSRDSWATPVVFHNLHCLKTIRQAQFPEHYPKAWELMKPQEDGAISTHFDHCLDNLRQAIMCQGDMALYHYTWRESSTLPKLSMKAPHVCVNWDRLYNWANENKFSINDGVLIHPEFGQVDPSTWVEQGKALDVAKHHND